MAILLLIRHGENDFVGRRLAGRLPDVHLNARGQHQAEAIAAALRREPITAIYASPLERTLETAAPLARDLYLPVIPETGLLEVDFGQWQGKTLAHLRRLKLWQTVQKNPAQMTFPQGESFTAAQKRVAAALERINSEYSENERIACFSHSDTIRLALAYFLELPLNSFQHLVINPASISRIHLNKHGAFLLQCNQTLLPEGD